MTIERKKTYPVKIRDIYVGGDHPIPVQSMANTHTEDSESTISQIHRLESAGCDIVRVSCYSPACAEAIRKIRDSIRIPLVADIHFDYRMAIAAIENGADKIRFNPGNIGSEVRVKALVDCAKSHHVPIRIGVNAGSLEKDLKERFGPLSPKAMVESAMRHVRLLERQGFSDIVISLKASDVKVMISAYRSLSGLVDYPLHVGVTETGSVERGITKSCIGIGSLLLDGIGDTLRVSLTDDPVREVHVGKEILRAIGLLKDDVEIISCPTCGRTQIDLKSIVEEVERRLPRNRGYLKVAVMGCAVNGPGEASDADIGIAFGKGNGVLFRHGRKVCSGTLPGILDLLIEEASGMLAAPGKTAEK